MYLLTQRSCLSAEPSVSAALQWCLQHTGCLLVCSHIKGLPDSTNQIIFYKQKDLLQLVIDFSYPLCSVDRYDC